MPRGPKRGSKKPFGSGPVTHSAFLTDFFSSRAPALLEHAEDSMVPDLQNVDSDSQDSQADVISRQYVLPVLSGELTRDLSAQAETIDLQPTLSMTDTLQPGTMCSIQLSFHPVFRLCWQTLKPGPFYPPRHL